MSKTLQELHNPVQGWKECEHSEKGEWCPTVRDCEYGPCCGEDPEGDYSEHGSSRGGQVIVQVCEHCVVGPIYGDLPDVLDYEDVAKLGEAFHRIWPCPTAQAMAEAGTELADTGRLMAWG